MAQTIEQYSLRHSAVALRNKKFNDVRQSVDKLFNTSYVGPFEQHSFFSSLKKSELLSSKMEHINILNPPNSRNEYTKILESQKQQQMELQMHVSLYNGAVSVSTLYSFIASIMKNTINEESDVIRQLEKIPLTARDMSHFYHIIDELLCLPSITRLLLTSFFVSDTTQLAQSFRRAIFAMPILSLKPTMSSIAKRVAMCEKEPPEYYSIAQILKLAENQRVNNISQNIFSAKNKTTDIDELLQISDRASYDLPQMRPITLMPRPNTVVPIPKNPLQMNLSLIENRPIEAIRIATTYIEAGNRKDQMYMIRSLGYYKINQIPAAIIDMSRSIDLNPTPEKYRARAGYYLILGDREMSSIDEQRSYELEHSNLVDSIDLMTPN